MSERLTGCGWKRNKAGAEPALFMVSSCWQPPVAHCSCVQTGVLLRR